MKLNNQSIKLFGFLLIFATISAFSQKPESNLLKSYNFIWDTPSKNALGSMPVGGGEKEKQLRTNMITPQ